MRGSEHEVRDRGWRQGIALSIAAGMTFHESPDDAGSRLAAVRAAMAKAAALAKRPANAVTLIAVSKTHGVDAIRPLIDAGQRVFGENRVQEAEAKWPALREENTDLALHLIGQLQSNKADAAVALFDAIHSDILRYGKRVNAPIELLIASFDIPSADVFWVSHGDTCTLGIKLWSNEEKRFVCN